MKGKLMIHYAISFILACLVIFFINITFIGINIYREGALYNYHPEKMISDFKGYIYLSEDNEILITDDGIKLLESNNMGVQILDENNQEVFQYNKPNIAPFQYSNVSLVDMYSNKEETLFLDEKIIDDTTYTYLLFLDSNKVKRITYSYDVKLIEKAHKFILLIIINIILVLIISFLYTLKITRPINRIVNKILDLSDGNYSRSKIKRGSYYKVEKCLNQLAYKLHSNEMEREKLEEMRTEWISNISHDIKTPLTSIIGNAEIMADTEYEINDEIRGKCCNTIINKSEYIKTLVEDLNLSTRLKNNILVLNKKKINIVSLIRHVLIDIINDEKYNDSNISFNYSDEEISLELDEYLVKRVFINLIINAFVHNSSDVKININIQKVDDTKIEISIEDNGEGVSEEDLNNIFKRYYRGTNTSKKTEGSGLGMAIAHDILKAHGADIKATGKLGEGLRIDIQFKKSTYKVT
ncbi:sensor signal transduction histidine kinase [Gottschalkia acidurici 9a]|uniref:histidine kinase n=1 Tax=Gottschalkia acidurici (strain ATCC 7906 / DSM 604 / BCRC 14475 / CIP 104303 / KCTC 5404 / NCIMB 10678 / 9a) TaxID=1128398 RepID=K0B1Z6_GOTA9|nr:HAMP domain-containing sensor histidine kinase [Gottschalkia acidurici]AFS78940.1 sensor signal transduction histidine kinase [Gottschalkia acidurici 9a]